MKNFFRVNVIRSERAMQIEKLYNKTGDYKADYCIKCKGIY